MPLFRTRPSSSLASSVRNLVMSAGDRLGPMQEIQADMAAAATAQRLSLAEKARAEAEAVQRSMSMREDPNLRTEYAAHSAGVNTDDASRLVRHIRGELEQPGPSDIDDAAAMGAEAQPYRTAKPNIAPGQERTFRSALASTIGNLIATGKTNAAQMAQAGDRINETALTTEAANTADVPAANRIIAAVSGKLREPHKLGAQGQVLNEETGVVNEGTALARAAASLSAARAGTEGARQGELRTRAGLNTARTTTEGSRQTELGSRVTRNTAAATLANERAGAVRRGETNKGGARVTPQQVERWVSEVARKEWDTIPAAQRKGMNFQQHLDKVRVRFQSGPGGGNANAEIEDAHAAIAKGADLKMVSKRFKERMGFDLPAPPVVDTDEDEDEED